MTDRSLGRPDRFAVTSSLTAGIKGGLGMMVTLPVTVNFPRGLGRRELRLSPDQADLLALSLVRAAEEARKAQSYLSTKAGA